MNANPPEPDRREKELVTDHFVDQIREKCTDDTGNGPFLVFEKIANQEAENDSGDQMEGKLHGLCLL